MPVFHHLVLIVLLVLDLIKDFVAVVDVVIYMIDVVVVVDLYDDDNMTL